MADATRARRNITLTNTGRLRSTTARVTQAARTRATSPSALRRAALRALLRRTRQCTISAAFVPTVTGARSETVTVQDSDPKTPPRPSPSRATARPRRSASRPASVTFANPMSPACPRPSTSSRSRTRRTARPADHERSRSPARTSRASSAAPTPAPARNARGRTRPARSTSSSRRRRPAAHRLPHVDDTGSVAPHKPPGHADGHGHLPEQPEERPRTVGLQQHAHLLDVADGDPLRRRPWSCATTLHYPTNPGDGSHRPPHLHGDGDGQGPQATSRPTSTGCSPRYHSITRPSQVNYSTGVRFKLATGEICTPQNGARLREPAPRFTWLAALHPERLRVRAPAQRRLDHDQVHAQKTSWQLAGVVERSRSHPPARPRPHLHVLPLRLPEGRTRRASSSGRLSFTGALRRPVTAAGSRARPT